MNGNYWSDTAFNFADAVNTDVFQRSTKVQSEEVGRLSATFDFTATGSRHVLPLQSTSLKFRDKKRKEYSAITSGAQQASRVAGPGFLPWLPDLVGKRWKERESILVCGAAYAGILPLFGGPGRFQISVEDYSAARTSASLQSLFLHRVVAPGPVHNYYRPIQDICSFFQDASRVAIFDVCRASFTEFALDDQNELFEFCDQKALEREEAEFAKYVECPSEQAWLRRRVEGGNALRIAALGSVAEHALIRLFARCDNLKLYLQDAGTNSLGPYTYDKYALIDKGGSWVHKYAYPSLRSKCHRTPIEDTNERLQNLQYWIDSGSWWSVRVSDNDKEVERWRLVPLYHPRFQNSTTVTKSRALLEKAIL
jgi:hypothetical protein